jgi:CIC family chloride channel protein
VSHPLRRLVLLASLGALLGLVGGGAAWVLIRLIAVITNAALLGRWGTTLPSFAHFHPGPWLPVVAVTGGLIVAILARWAPPIRGHGIPEAMEAVLVNQSRVSPRVAIAKPLSAAIAIGTGGPFGAEGPIIVTGGAVGSLVGQFLPLTPSERKILLASGAAAGMAATFGAPLAAVVLAVELLLFEYSIRALAPLIAASSVAGAMHFLLFGSRPLFAVPAHRFAGLTELPIFIGLGLVCGLLAVVIVRGLFLFERGFRRSPIPQFFHPMIGALGFAAVGFAAPRALGVGYGAIDDALAGRLAVATLAVLLVAKLVAWWVALSSGTSGGTLAPILLMASCFGGLYAAGAHEAFPGLAVSTSAIAVVAMAATFGAATRAVFTSVVFAFELTRDYRAIVPLMLAAVIADLVARALSEHDIMTEKLARRGLTVPRGYEPDHLQTIRVGEAMTTPVDTIPVDATVRQAREQFLLNGHGAFPITDEDGRCIGVVSRTDLLEATVPPDDPLTEVASLDPVTIERDSSLLAAMQLIIDEDVDHLPVVDGDGRLLGICTRTDILRSRLRLLDAERPDAGWRPRWRAVRRHA